MNIRDYKESDIQEIEKFILDEFVKIDIINCLKGWPSCAIVAEENEKVIAVAVFTGIDIITSITLYVKEEKRKQGIGSKLIKKLEEKAELLGVKKISCDFKVNEREENFISQNGYKDNFYSNFMVYDKGILDIEEKNYSFINYEERDYLEVQKLINEAFYRMLSSIGIETEQIKPSEEEKTSYEESKKNMFLLRIDNEIVGVIKLINSEIDGIAIKIEKQGQGYGKDLLKYGINYLLNKGKKKVYLWAIEGNKAKYLYEKVGFKVERVHKFMIKEL